MSLYASMLLELAFHKHSNGPKRHFLLYLPLLSAANMIAVDALAHIYKPPTGVNVSSVVSAEVIWRPVCHRPAVPNPQQWWPMGARFLLKFECGAVIKTYCSPTDKSRSFYGRCAEAEPQGIQNECIHYCGAFGNLQEMELTAYIVKFYSNGVICCTGWLKLFQLGKPLKVIPLDCF